MKKQTWRVIRSIPKTQILTRSFSSDFSVKKVTKTNFNSAFQDLKTHVKLADFIAIDLEMTGVTSAPWRESLNFDRTDVHYLKVKDSAEKFAVVQFGVCPFRWDSDKESFIAHPHTFYVFPRKEHGLDAPCNEFLCQTTSMDFLAKYQFDFNACIYEGISYLSRAQEGALNRLLFAYEDELFNSECHLKETVDIPMVGVADVLFTERMKNRFCEWRDGLLRNTNGDSQFEEKSVDSKAQMQIVFFKMHPALELNGFTSHQLRLIQLVIRKHFKDLIYIRINGENESGRKLVVYADSDDEKHIVMKEVKDSKRKEAKMKLKAAVGFRHVIDLLCSEQKLVVGHNCFLDVAHIHNKFLGPLPSTIEEFVSSINEHFPSIIDTKYLLNTDNILQYRMKKSSTTLSKAFSYLCPQSVSKSSILDNLPAFSYLCPQSVSKSSILDNLPASVKFEVQVDEMRSSNWNSGAKHEAGYDAFMTGCVFAQASSHLGIDFKHHIPSSGFTYNERLQKYMNHLYVSWRNGSIIDLCTGKIIPETSVQKSKQRYPKVIFQNIVLLSGFSLNLKPAELKECLCKVFGLDSISSIYYLDKTTAFIQFSKKELVSDFLSLKENLEKKNDAVAVLHPLSKILDGGNTHAIDYETYKVICSSSISRVLFADQVKAVNVKGKTKEEKLREDAESEGAENYNSDSVTKNDTGQRSCETANDSSQFQLSCVELMDTLCGPESQLGKQTRASKL